jgi:hypothetical protein
MILNRERQTAGRTCICSGQRAPASRSEARPPDEGQRSILYLIYIVLTVLEFLFLVCGRVPVFDSVTLAFGTAGTGGFAIRNDSLMSYSLASGS